MKLKLLRAITIGTSIIALSFPLRSIAPDGFYVISLALVAALTSAVFDGIASIRKQKKNG